jgi:2'-5' RNA ligase
MKRKLAVVAYPVLDDADRGWLESFRANHDPQGAKLPAHFTLVFPTEVSMDDVINEVATAACSIASFAFVVRSARAVREVSRPGGHVFLVPEEGAAEIIALHDRLYGGAFHSSLRSDKPYLPHITVAAGSEWRRCEALANDLNRDVRVVGGRVEAIELLDVGVGEVTSVAMFPLGHS